MAKEIYHLEQDLATIETKTADLAAEICDAYEIYLQLLAEFLAKYLIFAGYQICTKFYAENFLSLSLTQRQNLQQSLRQISAQGDRNLQHLIAQLQSGLESSRSDQVDNLPSSEDISESIPELPEGKSFDNPEYLLQVLSKLEQAMVKILQGMSNNANLLLQEANVLSAQLPAKVLEAATQVEGSNSSVSGTMNLINVLVEIEQEESDQNSDLTKITAIYLRLGEIEFAESSLSIQRSQIRDLVASLKNLAQQYRKSKKQLTLAQAEAAWRASWFED